MMHNGLRLSGVLARVRRKRMPGGQLLVPNFNLIAVWVQDVEEGETRTEFAPAQDSRAGSRGGLDCLVNVGSLRQAEAEMTDATRSARASAAHECQNVMWSRAQNLNALFVPEILLDSKEL